MNIDVEVLGGVPVLRVTGEVDMSNTSLIERTVAAEVSNKPLGTVLDLSSVTYLDSSGIRLLFQLEADLVTHGQRLVIIVPSGAPILRTLQAAGVIGSLVLASSTEAALALVSVHPEARVYPPEVRDGDGAA